MKKTAIYSIPFYRSVYVSVKYISDDELNRRGLKRISFNKLTPVSVKYKL